MSSSFLFSLSVLRRVAEAVQDRDVRLSDLQSKIEELSRAKELAVEGSGSEVASLELKLATAIKDNSELLRMNKWAPSFYFVFLPPPNGNGHGPLAAAVGRGPRLASSARAIRLRLRARARIAREYDTVP